MWGCELKRRAWVLLVLAAGVGCTAEPDDVTISRILIDTPPQFDADQKARETLREKIRASLVEDPTVEGIEDVPDASHRLHIRVHPVISTRAAAHALAPQAGGPSLLPIEGDAIGGDMPAGAQDAGDAGGPDAGELPAGELHPEPAAAAAPNPPGGEPVEDAGPLVRPVEVRLVSLGEARSYETMGKGLPDGDLVAAVLAGFGDAWPVLTRMRTLSVSKTGAVLEVLGHEDARLRGFAIEELGGRRAREAVQPLIARLTLEEREDLTLRIVGALVAIGDEAAVGPLIDLTRQRDPGFVLQIVFAVSAIGGRTAEGFLVTLASGHPHPAVQQGAKDALAEMQRAQGKSQGG